MKRLYDSPLAALMVFCVLSMVACGPLSDPKDPTDVGDGWPDVVECAVDGVLPDFIDTVTRILLGGAKDASAISDSAKAELEALGEKHGYKAVACVVDKVISDWASPGATQTPERMGAVERGRNFFESEGITVLKAGGPQAWTPLAPLNGYVVSVPLHFEFETASIELYDAPHPLFGQGLLGSSAL